MKRFLFAALLMAAPLWCSSQEIPSISHVFKEMPDSLMPYLSKNNRLDMIDFMEAKMKAVVNNLLDGKTVMTSLTADSLSIDMNGTLHIDMKIVPAVTPSDSCLYNIQVHRIYTLNENQTESVVDVYTSAWNRISSQVERSSLLNRDEKIFERSH